MIPDWDSATGNLPEGIHQSDWKEVEERLGFNPRRRRLVQGLGEALDILQRNRCERVWIDGSFVTDEPELGDFDCCWDFRGAAIAGLQMDYPIFFDFSDGRRAQKQRFGGEFFLAHVPADLIGTLFLDFFQTDKRAGNRKGIIEVDLTSEEVFSSKAAGR